MNKKKIVISLLVLIMVLSLALTALVGCDGDKKEKPTPTPTPGPNVAPDGYRVISTTAASALSQAVYNTAAAHKVNSLAASASLKVTAKYGEAVSEYLIKFGANVALKADDTNRTSFGLSIVDTRANNANILNVYYYENPGDLTGVDREHYKLGSGDVYVDLGSGENQQKLRINGLSLKAVLASEEVKVTDEEASKINTTVGDAIDSALDTISMVFGIGEFYQKDDNSELFFQLSLAKFFENAGQLLDGLAIIDEYTEKLGLALKSTDIKTLLPALTLDMHFKMEDAGVDDFEDAIIAGVDVKIGVAKKDFKIQRNDDDKTNFIRINIDKDVELGLDLDFKFGGTANIPAIIGGDYNAYKKINAINFTAGGELELKEAIQASFDLNGEKSIGLEKGTYSIKIAADINPVALLNTKFNTETTDDVLNLVSDILEKAVSYLSVDIRDKANPDDTSKQLIVSLVKESDGLKVKLTNLALLGELGEAFGGLGKNGVKLASVMNIVKGFIPASNPETGSGNADASGNGSGNASGESGASGDSNQVDVDKIMAILAPIIKNLTIEVNGDTDFLSVVLKDQIINENKGTDKETGEDYDLDDTTLDVTVKGNKSGLTVDAALKNTIIDGNKADITAQIAVNSNGVTISAQAPKLKLGGSDFPIDLVIRLTSFEIGNAQA